MEPGDGTAGDEDLGGDKFKLDTRDIVEQSNNLHISFDETGYLEHHHGRSLGEGDRGHKDLDGRVLEGKGDEIFGVDHFGGDKEKEHSKEEVVLEVFSKVSEDDKTDSLTQTDKADSLTHHEIADSSTNNDIADSSIQTYKTDCSILNHTAPCAVAMETMSSIVQERLEDFCEPTSSSGNFPESPGKRDDESRLFDVNDVASSVRDDAHVPEETAFMTMQVEQGHVQAFAGTVENVPLVDQSEDEARLNSSGQFLTLGNGDLEYEETVHRSSQFPALDNVDLESDEEADRNAVMSEFSGVLDDDRKSCDEGAHEKVVETGKRVISKNLANRVNYEMPSTVANFEVIGDGLTGHDDGANVPITHNDDGDKSSNVDLYKKYPLNSQNYKVCRELSPGVKQCLILETGEEYICITENKSVADASVDHSLVDMEADRLALFTRSKSSHPGGPQAVGAVNNRQTLDKDKKQTSDMDKSLVNAEAFSYVSLQQDGRGTPGDGGLEDNAQQHVQSSQVSSTFEEITENREYRMVDHADEHDESQLVSSDDEDGLLVESNGEVQDREVVEDVLLDDGAEETHHSSSTRQPSLKSYRRVKPMDKFFELQPEIAADIIAETTRTSETDTNTNNNSNDRFPDTEATNKNENANSHPKGERQQQRRDVTIRSSHQPSARSYHDERADRSRYISGSTGVNSSVSRTYSQPPSTEGSYFDTRVQRLADGSSYYRSRESNLSPNSSQISTRYTRINRGDPKNKAIRSESVTIPHFKTLHDQQVNWQEMFRVIEKQHRIEMKAQYQEHQQVIQEMQKNMEEELLKQQDTLKQRLLSHREMLEELSPERPAGKNINHSWTQHEGDSLSMDSMRSSSNAMTNNTSHITLQGVQVALRNPPPISRYHLDTRPEHRTSDERPVQRSLEKEFSSPVRTADISLNLKSHTVTDRDKQLTGGVYSSPLPVAKVQHMKSPRGCKSCENTRQQQTSQDQLSHNTNAVHWVHGPATQAGSRQYQESPNVSLTESDDVISPRTRISLKEKHAKHLADLRTYYEKELQELREVKGYRSMTAEDKILANENQELRQKYQEVQEAFHDAKIEIRELQQKMQGLEIRASDYAERYSTAQSQVLTLKSRLEELADYAREKEAAVDDLSKKVKKNAESLLISCAKEKELTESLHNAKNTISKLVDKYETLEKEHFILKETSAETMEKHYCSRAELVEANNKLSRQEVENKQLKQTIENLRHNLSIAQEGSLAMHTSYEDAYHNRGNSDHNRGNSDHNRGNSDHNRGSPDRPYIPLHASRSRSTDRSYNGHSGELAKSDVSSDSGSDNDYKLSPLMRAERELKKLQQSQVFTPKLQRKFYGTERPASYSGPTVDSSSGQLSNSPLSNKSQSPRDRRAQPTSQGRESTSRTSTTTSYLSRSQHDGSRPSKGSEKTSSYISYTDNNSSRHLNNSPKKPNIGLSSEQAIEMVKSREVVSRPAWEDIYTSMSSRPEGEGNSKGTSMNYTREQIFRERMQNIEKLEKKYDNLTNEKRKFEAALSKLPVQGHGRERDRLESELDRVDRELGSVRMSLKRYHVLKSTI